jgi:crotonobetainyl-CoA:carnitine CoA-transferase CaiB-like acyl-CoA transferase
MLVPPTRAPNVGEHTDEVLSDFAGYDGDKIKALREAGVVF